MIDFIKMFFSKTWEFFSITWPGFSFSIGSVFLGLAVSVGALRAVLKMAGVSLPQVGPLPFGLFRFEQRGGNNALIKVSDERRLDTK